MRSRYSIILCVVFFGLSCIVNGQTWPSHRPLDDAINDPDVQRAIENIRNRQNETARLLVEIGGIISPSGQEHERAEAVAEEMRRIGLEDVHVDDMPNAIGKIPGRSGKALIFVATLDDLTSIEELQRAAGRPPQLSDDKVMGPGTNTSSITVAMLSAAKALVDVGFQPEHDLVFAGVAQEETGLKGMHDLYEEYKDIAVAFVDILGDGRSVSYGAIGIHWWKIIASGPGGHTLSGGLPNINQAIGRAVDRILQIPEPELFKDRRARLNVAILNSGAVFNHKPESGWFSLDVRSLDADIIATMEQKVSNILTDVSAELGIALTMEAFSKTPPGQIPGIEDSPLVQTAAAIARIHGYEARLSNSGSSNLNVAIAAGTPAIGLGGERGGRRGFPDEWADIAAMQRSAESVLLLAVTMANARTNARNNN
jgi:acetylornithine deacetylase/succinyl-diaminopimelate desuccinylase-like protein